jgi:hypothetical protein
MCITTHGTFSRQQKYKLSLFPVFALHVLFVTTTTTTTTITTSTSTTTTTAAAAAAAAAT